MPSRDVGQFLLRAVDPPLRCEVATVLARIRVADHHLDPSARAEAPVLEQLLEDRRRGSQVVHRLEQRHDRELVAQRERAVHVVRGRRAGDDQSVERLRSVLRARLDRRRDRLAGAVGL